MLEQTHAKPDAESDTLVSRMLFIVGFGGHVALQLLGFFGAALPFLSNTPPSLALATQTLFFVSLIATTTVLANNVGWVVNHTHIVMMASFALSLTPALCFFVFYHGATTSLLLLSVPWVFFGIALCGFRVCWAARMALLSTAPIDITIGSAYLLGGALVALVAWLDSATSLMAVGFLCAGITTMAMMLISRREKYRDVEQLMQWRQYEPRRLGHALPTLALGLLFGFTIASIVSLGGSALAFGSIGLLAGSIVALIAIALAKRREFSLSVTLKRLLPNVWLLVVLFPLVPTEARIVCCCIIVGMLIYNHINYNIFLLSRSIRHRLNPITYELFSENPHWLGMLVGLTLAFLAFFQFALTDVELLMAEIVCFIIVAAYILRSSYARSNMSTASELEPSEETSGQSPVEENRDAHGFDARCDEIMSKIGLTKREMDVFRLLARGRNAEYISNKLYVSRATTKTHIYHIYAKLGVNSQQDLLSLVEDEQAKP